MHGSRSLVSVARSCRPVRRSAIQCAQRRALQISTTPTAESPLIGGDAINSSIDPSLDPAGMLSKPISPANANDPLDARFEVIGAPYSLLSVSLSASQRLYTRRGTLVGVSGKAENVGSLFQVDGKLLTADRHNLHSQS
jgi:hypothetical protein